MESIAHKIVKMFPRKENRKWKFIAVTSRAKVKWWTGAARVTPSKIIYYVGVDGAGDSGTSKAAIVRHWFDKDGMIVNPLADTQILASATLSPSNPPKP